jgi:hypothetical protein
MSTTLGGAAIEGLHKRNRKESTKSEPSSGMLEEKAAQVYA